MNSVRVNPLQHAKYGNKPRALFRRIAWGMVWLMAGAILVMVFFSYRQPGFLLDFLNLRYCG